MKAAGPVPKSAPLTELGLYFVHAGLSLPMVAAVCCYGLSFLLWLGVLSQKDVSLARPMMSLGYLVTLAYGFYAGEQVTWERVLGTVLLIAGLFFVVRSDLVAKPGSLLDVEPKRSALSGQSQRPGGPDDLQPPR